jgi:hypothetical protein
MIRFPQPQSRGWEDAMGQLYLELVSPVVKIAIPLEIKVKDALLQEMAAMLLVVARAEEQSEKEEPLHAERQDNR